MLEHLGEHEAAEKLERAVAAIIEEGKDVTYDMKDDRNDPPPWELRRWPKRFARKWANSG